MPIKRIDGPKNQVRAMSPTTAPKSKPKEQQQQHT